MIVQFIVVCDNILLTVERNFVISYLSSHGCRELPMALSWSLIIVKKKTLCAFGKILLVNPMHHYIFDALLLNIIYDHR